MNDSNGRLRRELGLLELVGVGVGGIVGSGIFMMPAAVAAESGPLSLVAWAIAGAAMTIIALTYAELGSTYPLTGGPYYFPRRAFGELIGFVVGWGYWVSCFVAVAAVTNAFINYLSFLVPGLAVGMKLTPLGLLAGVATIWLLTLLNVAGVKWGGLYAVVTTVLKVLPLLAFCILGLASLNAQNFLNVPPNWARGIGLGIALSVWAYMGFEDVTIPSEEVRRPKKDIPRSVIAIMATVTIVYLLVSAAFLGLIRWSELGFKEFSWSSLYNLSSPLSDVASAAGLEALSIAILIGAVISTGGCAGVWILGSGRIAFAMARDQLLPRFMSGIHTKFGTPHVGLIISSILSTVTLLAIPFFPAVALVGTLTAIIPYALAALSLVVLRGEEVSRPFKLPAYKLLSFIGFAFATYIAYWSCWPWTLIGLLLIALGLPVYTSLRGFKGFKESYWLWIYLVGIALISLTGDPYFEYENPLPISVLGLLPYPLDLLACTLLSVVIFYLATR